MNRSFFFDLIAVVIFLVGAMLSFEYVRPGGQPTSSTIVASATASTPDQLSAAVTAFSGTAFPFASSSATYPTKAAASSSSVTSRETPSSSTVQHSTIATSGGEISRIQDPYRSAPESFAQVNADTRNALVNILCEPNGATSLDPISGSGVLIDPQGIILTNAHVAQYVLLSESPQVNLRCYVRTGSPATITWNVYVLYIPPVWVDQHFSEINQDHPVGTGEHDYALLYITSAVNGTPLPGQFPYLPFDTRPAIGFPGDQVLVASYPAELVGGVQTEYGLYADTSVTTIKQLLTFGSRTPDVVSLGGVIEAQEGSSGGAVVNQWGELVALISTTSSGTTTSNRDLRGISLNYINADISTQSGTDLDSLLKGDPAKETQKFNANTAPGLVQLYVGELSSREQ